MSKFYDSAEDIDRITSIARSIFRMSHFGMDNWDSLAREYKDLLLAQANEILKKLDDDVPSISFTLHSNEITALKRQNVGFFKRTNRRFLKRPLYA